MRTILIIAAVAAAMGSPALCAQKGAADSGPQPDANLFIFRDHAEPTAWKPTVKIDGRKVIALGENRYTAIRMAPGRHEVKLGWPLISAQGGSTFELTVEPGKSHYLEIVGQSRLAGVGYNVLYYKMGSGIGEAKPDYATHLISTCCRYSAPE
jgi:hypothetical protein